MEKAINITLSDTDEDNIGYSYADVDSLLYYMVHERFSRDELIEEGFSESLIDKVANMVSRA